MDLIKKEIILKEKGLDGLLLMIAKHGIVALYQFNNGGWYCRCDMKVNGVGVNFQINSDTDHKSPTEATRLCLFRITETLAKYGITA